MSTARRRLAIALLTFTATACGESGLATVPVVPPPPLVPTQPPPTQPTPLTGPFRTFVFERGLTANVQGYTNSSQFLLYDNGSFALVYSSELRYLGRYVEQDSMITMTWDGWSIAGPWGATAVRSGDELAVHFNLVMQMSDFEDAIYRQR